MTQTESYAAFHAVEVAKRIRIWEKRGWSVRSAIVVEVDYASGGDKASGLRDWLVVYETAIG